MADRDQAGAGIRILVAADDASLGAELELGLNQRGFRVDLVRDARAALRATQGEPFAALVLDLGMPHADCIDVMSAVCTAIQSTPVLVLTTPDAAPDRVRGQDTGANDYCVKPVDMNELAARLRILVRSFHGGPQICLCVHGLVLDPDTRVVSLHGNPVTLSAREFDVLQVLMLGFGRVQSREQLEHQVYRWGQEVDSNAIEVHVHHLRRKLRPDLILTVRGAGYVLPREISD